MTGFWSRAFSILQPVKLSVLSVQYVVICNQWQSDKRSRSHSFRPRWLPCSRELFTSPLSHRAERVFFFCERWPVFKKSVKEVFVCHNASSDHAAHICVLTQQPMQTVTAMNTRVRRGSAEVRRENVGTIGDGSSFGCGIFVSIRCVRIAYHSLFPEIHLNQQRKYIIS